MTAAAPPTADPSAFDAIPAELRERPQWVVWRSVTKAGARKPTKVPFDAVTGRPAAVNDPRTFATFGQARAAYARDPGRWAGIGYVFTADDPYVGVDLDNSLDARGRFRAWAAAVLPGIGPTYGEISPSFTGVKFVARGALPGDRKGVNRKGFGPDGTGGIEVYDHGRFFAMTGRRHPVCPAAIEDRGDNVAELYLQLRELDDKPPGESGAKPPRRPTPAAGDRRDAVPRDRESRALGYILKTPDAITGQRGHDKALRWACECRRFGLDRAASRRVMLAVNDTKTGGEPWNEREIEHKLDSAETLVTGADFGSRLGAGRPPGGPSRPSLYVEPLRWEEVA